MPTISLPVLPISLPSTPDLKTTAALPLLQAAKLTYCTHCANILTRRTASVQCWFSTRSPGRC